MNIFSKNYKNVFAKNVFLPFLFVAFFVFSLFFLGLNSINSNLIINANQYNTSINNSQFVNNNISNTNDSSENSVNFNLPTQYTLFTIDTIIKNFSENNKNNTNNLIKNVGIQDGTSICWAFAVNTALETTLYKSGIVSTDEKLNFSELNMAYVSQVINKNRTIISGGNFDLAYEYLSSEYGPVFEQSGEGYNSTNQSSWATDSGITSYYKSNYYNTSVISPYRVLEAVSFPEKNKLTTIKEKEDLRLRVKNHILNYGAVTASIYMDSQNLYNKQSYVCTNSSLKQNHMVSLVGWNDSFTVSIGGKTYVGAYIAQNSRGTNWGMDGYFYIMYDDAFVENDINGFLRVANQLENTINYNNLKDTTVNNNFLTYTSTSSTSGETSYEFKPLEDNYYIANIYKREDVSNQFISRLKVPTSYNNKSCKFYVYVLDGLTQANVQAQSAINSYLTNNFSNAIPVENKYASVEDKYLFTANQPIYYTIETSNRIDVTSEYFAVIVKYVEGSVIRLSNDDGRLSQTYQFTYSINCLEDPNNWSLNYYDDNKTRRSIFPMIVQMKYDLGKIEYSSSNITKTYDAQKAEINIDVTTQCNYTIFYSLTGNDNDYTQSNPFIVDSGNYNIYFKIVADFYETEMGVISINISPKDLIITPIAEQKIYGYGDPNFGYTYFGNLEPVYIIGRLSRQSGEDVGSYQILQGSLELSSNLTFNKNNYNLVFSTNKVYFTITPRPLYVTPNLITKIYGEQDPEEYSYTYKNLATGELAGFSGALTRESGEGVGEYNFFDNGSLMLKDNKATNNYPKNFKASNYTLQLINAQGKFVIIKRDLIITPLSNQSKIYGEQDPIFKYNYSNNVTGEIPVFSGKLERVAGEDAGKHNFILGSLTLTNNGSLSVNNYNLILNSENIFFTITFGDLEGCSVNNIQTSYNGNYYSLNPQSTIHNDIIYSYSCDGINFGVNELKFKNAGTYNIYVKFSKENYNDRTILATIQIDSIEITITPINNQTKIYGEEDPEIQFIYTGNINGESPVFSGGLSRNEENNSLEMVGIYSYNNGNLKLEDNENFVADNYYLVFNLEGVTFSITKRNIIVNALAGQYKYYNTEDKSLEYTYSNVAFGEIPKFIDNFIVRESGEEVNFYNYKLNENLNVNDILQDNESFKSCNYNLILSNTETFEIKPAEIKIIINNEQSYYSEPIKTQFTYSISQKNENTGSYKEDDELNIVFICPVTESSLKGLYNITCTTNNKNYNVTVQEGKYEILYHSYLVKFLAYDEELKSFTAEHFYSLKNEDFPQVQAKPGYTFNSWLVMNNNGTFSVVTENYSITTNVIIRAFMQTNLYTINYHTNNGTFNPIITTYTVETQDVYLNEPVKQGWTFLGWYNNPSLQGEVIAKINKGSIGDITLYAKYRINTYEISFQKESNLPYSVIYEGSSSVEFSSSFKFTILLKEGYTKSLNKMRVYARLLPEIKINENQQNNSGISGNKTTQSSSGEIESSNIEELKKNELGFYTINNVLGNYEIYCENITLNVYSIFFMIDNNLVKQVKKLHGESLNSYEYPSIPEKEHYNETNPNWSIPSIEKIIQDEVIVANYIPNVHTITFVMPDGKTYITNVNYGENVSTKILEENHHLGLFDYYIFNTSLNNITEDKTIKVTVCSNIFILYIVLAVIFTIVTITICVVFIKKRKKDTFNWWVYTKRK